MNRFYCGAVFALAMHYSGHNLIQHVDEQLSQYNCAALRDGKMVSVRCRNSIADCLAWTDAKEILIFTESDGYVLLTGKTCKEWKP